jgi:hypothetical protein
MVRRTGWPLSTDDSLLSGSVGKLFAFRLLHDRGDLMIADALNVIWFAIAYVMAIWTAVLMYVVRTPE